MLCMDSMKQFGPPDNNDFEVGVRERIDALFIHLTKVSNNLQTLAFAPGEFCRAFQVNIGDTTVTEQDLEHLLPAVFTHDCRKTLGLSNHAEVGARLMEERIN